MDVPRLVTRARWNAAPFQGVVKSLGHPERIVVHHAAGYRAATLSEGKKRVREIQKLHQGPRRNWSDIGYHFLIDACGNIYQGRPFFEGTSLAQAPRLAMGAHVLNQNSRKIGICLLGCFHPADQGCNDTPTASATASLRQLLQFLLMAYSVPASRIATHRDFLPTSCPGDTLFALVDDLRTELSSYP
jgi:N-acetylmuramoyl-L-alanine amidase